MKRLIILMISCLLFLSCEQITKSIDETFKPNTEQVNKSIEKSDLKTSETVNPNSEEITKTVTETHSTTHTQVHIEKSGINFLMNTGVLEKAEEALRKLPQYNGKEILIYSTLYFYDDGTINVMLQHPENPKYVDAYEYRNNKWSNPRPVQLSVRDDIGSRLVSLNKINFESSAKVTDIYNIKAQQIEGAKPATSVYIAIWNNQIRWYPSTINGSRERYSIQFNDDGTLKSFKQD